MAKRVGQHLLGDSVEGDVEGPGQRAGRAVGAQPSRYACSADPFEEFLDVVEPGLAAAVGGVAVEEIEESTEVDHGRTAGGLDGGQRVGNAVGAGLGVQAKA